MNCSRETEVSRVEEKEFADCYRKLIGHFRLTPEESSRQLAEILRRLNEPGPAQPTPGKRREV